MSSLQLGPAQESICKVNISSKAKGRINPQILFNISKPISHLKRLPHHSMGHGKSPPEDCPAQTRNSNHNPNPKSGGNLLGEQSSGSNFPVTHLHFINPAALYILKSLWLRLFCIVKNLIKISKIYRKTFNRSIFLTTPLWRFSILYLKININVIF